MYLCVYIYIYIYLFIYGTPPPKDPCFCSLFSSSHMPTSPHDHSLILSLTFFFIITAGRSILKYWATLSFNMADPRSKIAQDSWGGILDPGGPY